MRKLWVLVRLAVALSVVGGAISAGVLPVAAQESVEELGSDGVGVLESNENTTPSPDHPTTPSLRHPITPSLLSDLELPAATVEEWVAQIEASLTQITGVRVEETEAGLQIVLETAEGELATPTTQTVGNALIAEIPNAVLVLPDGDSFEQFGPTEGIALVSVTNEPGDRVRVAITGTDAPPVAEVTAAGLAVTLGEALAGTGNEAIQVVVTGEQDEGYNPRSATTATRTDTPLRDIPQSIQVIPQQVIEDQGVTRVGEALQNVSGVSDAGLYNNYLDYIWLRGFPTWQGNFFRDGIRLSNYYTGAIGVAETSNLERIEVLKGPASILFGAVEPGGIINLITKSPLSYPFYSFEGSIGSYENYQGAMDLSGPLNEDGTILYRLNGLYSNSGSFRDFVDSERIFVAPTVSFALSPQTNLRVDGNFSRLDTVADLGIPAIGDRPADVPRNRSVGEPFSSFIYEDLTLGYTLTHALSDAWTLRNSFRYQSFVVPEFIGPLVSSVNEATGDVERFPYSQIVNVDGYSAQADVVGEFSTGSFQHRFLIGLDYNLTRQDRRFFFGDSYPSINIFDPIYANQPYDITPSNFFRDDRFSSYGLYIQDQITFSPQWKFLIGGRYDIFDQQRAVGDLEPRERSFNQTDSAFTPRLGIIFQPSDIISLYASYAKSFQPSLATFRNPDGSDFEPTTGTQYEIGMKTNFLDNRLSATLAGFILERQNVTTPDPDNPGFSTTTGEQTSKGIELDVSGEILPGWNIIAAATYLDARVTEDNRIPEGNRLFNVPETSASLWTTYRIQSGDLEGLGFGLGVYYVGDREGDLENSFILPSYVRTDAALYYERDSWRAALNIRNLFDITYFSGTYGSRTDGIRFGEPLTIIGSFSFEF